MTPSYNIVVIAFPFCTLNVNLVSVAFQSSLIRDGNTEYFGDAARAAIELGVVHEGCAGEIVSLAEDRNLNHPFMSIKVAAGDGIFR